MTKRLVQGNEAVLLGAIKAGATFFAGYPISPSSEILAQASVYAAGQLPAEIQAQESAPTTSEAAHMHVPDAAKGPAVAGTDPHRGMTDTESAPDVDRDNPT